MGAKSQFYRREIQFGVKLNFRGGSISIQSRRENQVFGHGTVPICGAVKSLFSHVSGERSTPHHCQWSNRDLMGDSQGMMNNGHACRFRWDHVLGLGGVLRYLAF